MSTTQHVSTSNSSTGIGCLGLAGLISIVLGVLKLAGVLEMSWLLVVAPVLVVLGISAAILLIALLILGITALALAIAGKRGRR